MHEFDPNREYPTDALVVQGVLQTFKFAADRAAARSRTLESVPTWHELVVLSIDDFELLVRVLSEHVVDDARARVLHGDLSDLLSRAPAQSPGEILGGDE